MNPNAHNPFPEVIREGISLITACRNRKETFERALLTWLQQDIIDEIIVVDWSSDQSLRSMIDAHQNGKVFLATVKDQARWILSHAYNLAARMTSRARILKMDADILLGEGFFDRHELVPGIFYAGNSARRRNENEKYLNGVLYLYREDFFKVNGYNEFIQAYGWDDEDIYNRLINNGLKRTDIDNDTVSHIPHERKRLTIQGYRDTGAVTGNQTELIAIMANRFLSQEFYPWTIRDRMTDFIPERDDAHHLVFKVVPGTEKPVPEHAWEQSVVAALGDLLKKQGLDAVSDILASQDKETLTALYDLFSSIHTERDLKAIRDFLLLLNQRIASLQGARLSTTNRLQYIPGQDATADKHLEGRYLMGGLRLKGFMKNDPETRPLVTVITVVRNGRLYIEETIRSVLDQSYDNVEYIVIDGDSTDGTLDIIRRYQDGIDLWISQPDDGIYQAMNKGIRLAKGRYIHFLNADDHYTDTRMIERIVCAFRKSDASLLYGDILMFDKKRGTTFVRHSHIVPQYFMFKGIPQQAFFYKKKLFDQYGTFDESLRIVGDVDYYLKLTRQHHIPVKYIGIPVVIFNTGGTSGNMKQKETEHRFVIDKYFSKTDRLLYKNWIVRKVVTGNDIFYNKGTFSMRLIHLFTGLFHKLKKQGNQ